MRKPTSKNKHTNSAVTKTSDHLQPARLNIVTMDGSSENWTLASARNKNSSKRNLSSSSSEQKSPKTKSNKKLFFTANRFEPLSQDDPMPTTSFGPTLTFPQESNPDGNINVGVKSTLLPPIFLKSLIHTKIKLEEPYKLKTISQCINCQDYCHTKTYCGYPARCVRCGALHSSSACTNPRDATPKCALCSGDHPSNYKGCSVYKELQLRNKPKMSSPLLGNLSHKKNVQVSQPVVTPLAHSSDSSQTYTQATSGTHPNNIIPPPVSDINNNSLLILLFNSNGLKNPSNELQLVLQEKRIDIALISETHFTKYSHISIPGYHLLKTNHPDNTAHSGAAIYIKSSFSFQLLPNFCQPHLQSCCQPHLQSCAILLHLNNIPTTHLNNIPTTLAAIYSPPRHNINIQNYMDYFSTFSLNFIIGGDFNAKDPSCRTNNPRGSVLYNFINLKGYSILAPPGPTYWPTSLRKKPDILDIFVSNTPHNLFCVATNLL
ncbi:Endonuclease/exonuclease/phosphatase [Cinara cedri]|uniref:Endonuclease/exonuclease/phosphatase n=1 Tax=Cinara cedri TaxID=506608 RepID=A0A5E4NKU5_9HEMI|nr:Endonuclease/exonuclease/phosphatase [Cinara cedri]